MIHLLRFIILLEKAVGAIAPRRPFTSRVFPLSGSVSQAPLDVVMLQHLAREMACFVNMPFFNILVTPAKQKDSVAGHIEGQAPGTQDVFIEIEPDFLRFPAAAIKVLAHELSHKYLEFHRLTLDSTKENEILTDVTAIYLGFGTFALNGGTFTETSFDNCQTVKRTVTNGYIDLDESAFVYDVVCRMRGIDEAEAFARLNGDAVKSVRRVRRLHAASYPPSNPDLSHVKRKIAYVRGKLELADLELCNIDKIKMLYQGALVTKKSEIDAARCDVVKTRCALWQVEQEVAAPVGRSTCLNIPVWTDSMDYLAGRSDAALATVQTLNGFVSKRVPPDVTRANWDVQENIVIECPKCGGRMRLPAGKAHIGVTCPKCKYTFDYSTTCPEFKWVPPPRFKEKPLPRLVERKPSRIKGWLANVKWAFVAKWRAIDRRLSRIRVSPWWLLLIFPIAVGLLNLRTSNTSTQHPIPPYGKPHAAIDVEEQKRLLKVAEDLQHETQPFPESGKVRILDEDKYYGRQPAVEGGCQPKSRFRITTPQDAYYLIKLVEWGSKTPVMDIFCHPGQTIEVEVPVGYYEARMAMGTTWYGYEYRFGRFTTYQKMDAVLDFTLEHGHHVTLKKVVAGNLRTRKIAESEF